MKRARAFEIRNHFRGDFVNLPENQAWFDRFNRYMALVGDLTFVRMLTSKPAPLARLLTVRVLGASRRDGRWPEVKSLLAAAARLLRLGAGRTAAELFCVSAEEDPKLAAAIRRIRELGVFLPPAPQTRRDGYFRRYVMPRFLASCGSLTPRDLFCKPAAEGTYRQRSIIMEAKMVGLLGGNSVGDGPATSGTRGRVRAAGESGEDDGGTCGCGGQSPPRVNDKVCSPDDMPDGVDECVVSAGSNCVLNSDGKCGLGTDLEPDEIGGISF